MLLETYPNINNNLIQICKLIQNFTASGLNIETLLETLKYFYLLNFLNLCKVIV